MLIKFDLPKDPGETQDMFETTNLRSLLLFCVNYIECHLQKSSSLIPPTTEWIAPSNAQQKLGLALQPCFPLLQVHGVCPFVRPWLFTRWVWEWDSNVVLLKHLETISIITLFHLYLKFWLKSRGNHFARSQDLMIHHPQVFDGLAWWCLVSCSGFLGSNVSWNSPPLLYSPMNFWLIKHLAISQFLKRGRISLPTSTRLGNIVSLMSHHCQLWVLL